MVILFKRKEVNAYTHARIADKSCTHIIILITSTLSSLKQQIQVHVLHVFFCYSRYIPNSIVVSNKIYVITDVIKFEKVNRFFFYP